MTIDKHSFQTQVSHWSENKMSAGALMWISMPLYIIENETFSQNKAIETLVSQICTQNLDILEDGLRIFHYSLAVQAMPLT